MGLLDNVLGGGRGGMSPLTMALIGLLAYKTLKGKNLSDVSGSPGAAPNASGGLGGMLGGLLGGGAAGSVLSGGLGDLLQKFQQTGHADVANSWVSTGQNKPVSPSTLEDTLGP